MFEWNPALWMFAPLLAMAVLTWLISIAKQDASIVDSVWSLFFAAVLVLGYLSEAPNGPRALAAAVLLGAWALRLCAYLTWRNWGQPEDRRYQAIRARNQPNYALKSLPYVFLLQAVLAWIIALPILPVLKSASDWGALDTLGVAVFVFGLVYETAADAQLARFKADPAARGAVMDRGLWRYCRHPNYFGECLLWWGFFLLALGAEAPAWLVVSPLLMTVLLLKVSGVPLLEEDLSQRRPGYREYVARTPAFIPGPPRGEEATP
jgi:steroid 5-alpha reductase family enzyme